MNRRRHIAVGTAFVIALVTIYLGFGRGRDWVRSAPTLGQEIVQPAQAPSLLGQLLTERTPPVIDDR